MQLCILLARSPEGIPQTATPDTPFGLKNLERSMPQFCTVGLGYILKGRMMRTENGNIFW